MTGLILRNPALRGLLKPLLLSALVATFVGNLVAFFAGSENRAATAVPWLELAGQLALIMPLVFVLYLGQSGQRARHTEMGWPLPATVLWTAHFLALVLAVGVLLAIAAAALAALSQVLTNMIDRPPLGLRSGLSLVLRPGAVSFAALALLVAWRPTLAQPERAAGWSRRRLVVTSLALLTTAALTWLPALVVVVPVLIGVGAVIHARRQVGPALELAGPDEAGLPEADLAAWESVRVLPGVVHRLIVRTVLKCPSYVIFLTLLLGVIGVALSGFFTRGSDVDAMRLSSFFLVVYILASPLGEFTKGMHKLDHLPIARRLLLAWLILPAAGSLILGYGIGQIGKSLKPTRPDLLTFVNEDEGYGLKLPPRFFQAVWQPGGAVVTAPWGESQELETWRVWPAMPLHLVKPYTTPAAASREFVAWQISRAVEAVYGTEIAPDEIAARYLHTAEAGRTEVIEAGLTLQEDYPTLRTVSGGPVFIVLVGSYFWALGLVVWGYFAALGRGFWRQRAKALFALNMVLLMAAHLVIGGGLMKRVYNEDIVFGLVQGQIRNLGASGALGWLAAAGVIVLGLWLVARQVDRVFAVLESPRA